MPTIQESGTCTDNKFKYLTYVQYIDDQENDLYRKKNIYSTLHDSIFDRTSNSLLKGYSWKNRLKRLIPDFIRNTDTSALHIGKQDRHCL